MFGIQIMPRQGDMVCLGVSCDCLDAYDWLGCHGGGSLYILRPHWIPTLTNHKWHHGAISLVVWISADSVQDFCKGHVQWASEVFQMIDGMYKIGFEFEALG